MSRSGLCGHPVKGRARYCGPCAAARKREQTRASGRRRYDAACFSRGADLPAAEIERRLSAADAQRRRGAW